MVYKPEELAEEALRYLKDIFKGEEELPEGGDDEVALQGGHGGGRSRLDTRGGGGTERGVGSVLWHSSLNIWGGAVESREKKRLSYLVNQFTKGRHKKKFFFQWSNH